jgi:brefeldin A-resistance guanine nucleotide exchange factor 1
MTHLQRLILGPAVSIADGDQRQIEELFSRVVFPLVDELLKPQVAQRDPPGMSETRLRASTLLCKAFMHFEVREGSDADIRLLWIQVLDLLDRLMKMDSQDQLVRDAPSSLPFNQLKFFAARSRPRIAEERRARHECCRHSRTAVCGRPAR